jgi:hypothetical protein
MSEITTAVAQPSEIVAAEKEIEEGTRALLAPSPRGITEPTNFDQAWKFAEIVAKSKMFGVTSPEDAFVRMSTGMTLGLYAIQSLNLIDAIPGADGSKRPALRAKLKVAIIRRSPVCEYFRCVESTDKQATYVAKRKGNPEISYTYTWDEAVKAGYTKKNNYQENPRAMLRARSSSNLAELEFPDVTGGIDTVEDLRDRQAVVAAGEAVGEWQTTAKVDHVAVHTKAIATLTTKAEIDAAWSAVMAAFKAGDIDGGGRDELKAIAKARGDQIKAGTAAPPPARPTPTETVTADGEVLPAGSPS